ncbi:TPA: hypothetical protein ACX6QF_000583 [Photobacterium damselae]|nr:hypothetical protein [Photobacterium damselae]EHA1079778.1 hypothetical protein [Photobacterium damselae]EJN6959762.1 hypothetical protein [Photobacterium damselae]ELI6448618.1 hypothetical protein [Photobacterium damselae]ELV7516260.1 hypothetical protein [Photobacterium damselae]MBA5681782.1 hypothetical protein [Photobacterium damselae subsp. damselae]
MFKAVVIIMLIGLAIFAIKYLDANGQKKVVIGLVSILTLGVVTLMTMELLQ